MGTNYPNPGGWIYFREFRVFRGFKPVFNHGWTRMHPDGVPIQQSKIEYRAREGDITRPKSKIAQVPAFLISTFQCLAWKRRTCGGLAFATSRLCASIPTRRIRSPPR